MEQPCAKTHARLDSWCAPGGVLDAGGDRASFRLYADDPSRRHTRAAIVDAYLAEQDGIDRDGRCAIVTAGVPGAGKSSAIESRGLAGKGWRVLDSDRIKDHLIRDGLDRGVYDDLLDVVLPDGRRLRPRELATLVHRESTQILDTVQEHCIEAGENIVIEGTFRWDGLGAQLLTELGGAGYTELTIVDVEVTCETALHRAQHRWWSGRIDPDNELGGRFTPTTAITDLYPHGSARSICARNARAAFDHPLSAVIESVTLFVDDFTTGTHVESTTTKHNGVVDYTSGHDD
ncbi:MULTISPECIES: zeta toxin family protein [unclassified Rhodococcus (in: high G+C Gram-positive bacteria)]|uniref:zeta toxin family protein n=1 Tax=unclassified Rhodococcus (in: high G+C Gram-positive bacteria) TaxID=192944 RepID=UPI00200B5737|nr:zeta toxin family protein [Rhodococcus sp. HM1]MCK8671533.1 zeta toxin family protein [Rhodococcus sp. HM1]